MKIVQNRKYKLQNPRLELIDNITDKFGPDPLTDLTEKDFRKILSSSKRAIKLVLMDQTKIAGVGNIYANEALFLTRINPQIPSNKISKTKAEFLLQNLQKVLKQAIKRGGASSDLYLDAYGRKGKAQEHFWVYGREGKKCLKNCGGIVQKIKLGGRGTYYCPKCQKI